MREPNGIVEVIGDMIAIGLFIFGLVFFVLEVMPALFALLFDILVGSM